MSRLAWTGNGVEPPHALAVFSIVSVDKSANTVLAAGDANDDEILHREGRDGETVTGLVVGGGHVPGDVAGLGIESDYVRVQGAQENSVAEDREPAVDASAARTNVRGQLMLIH